MKVRVAALYASATLAPIRLDPLREGLRQLGYVEGRNIMIEARWGEGNFQRLPELAAELVQLKVDVIVTAATLPHPPEPWRCSPVLGHA